ncbi:MAG: hypothetical protein WB784_03970 [Rhodanobacteraceae bacterium]
MFSPNHRQHLLVAFRHFDSMLADILVRLGAAPGEPLLESYRDDVDRSVREPAKQGVTEMRTGMRAFMSKHDLQISPPHVSAVHAAHAMLALLQVASSELGARHLRGYGELSIDEAAELDALSNRLRVQLGALDALLDRAQPGDTSA